MADIIDDDLAPSHNGGIRTIITVAVIATLAFGTWFLVAGISRNPTSNQVGDEESAGRADRNAEPLPRYERKEAPTIPDPVQKMDEPRR